MKVALSILLVLVVALAQTGKKETQQRLVFQDFQRALDQLKQRPRISSDEPLEADIDQSINKISEHVKFLAELASAGKPMPKEYSEGISLDAKLLKNLAQQPPLLTRNEAIFTKD